MMAAEGRIGRGLAVMEGSTVVELAQPDLLLFVAHPFLSPSRWKPTSAALLARADVVVVNLPSAETRPPSPAVLAEIAAHHHGREVRVADVTQPLAEWAPDLAARLAALGPVPRDQELTTPLERSLEDAE